MAAAAAPPDHDAEEARQRWRTAVRGVILRGRPDATDEEFEAEFARQLMSITDDGLAIQPLYDAYDTAPPAGLPGFAPFTRAAGAAPSQWEIRQRVWAGVDGSSAVGELEAGATGVLLDLPADADQAALDAALAGVFLDLAAVSLAAPAGPDGTAHAGLLIDRWRRAEVPALQRTGTLGLDPLGAWARSGGATDLAASLAGVARLTSELVDEAPKARPAVADGTVWHDGGASDGQELAWTIAAATHTVRAMVDAGVPLVRAVTALEFRWAATADQFATIAKLRAARRLWARVAEIAGLDPAAQVSFHTAETSRAMITRYDPWVNALRSTVACFAAAMGGAAAITVLPHDSAIVRGGSSLGRRIARNTQAVLMLESNLWRVLDPAGGSWYVERLTDDLATTAWEELRRVEAAGGIVAALEQGAIDVALRDQRAQRDRQVATRRRALTGLSEFPDIAETPPPPIDDDEEGPASPFPPVRRHRLAEGFERQRGRADAHARLTGERPRVYLAVLGTAADYTARATFAKNLFEAGGIVTVAGPVGERADHGTAVTCLCSSDKVYAEQGEAAIEQLRTEGAGRVYVAGRRTALAADEEVGVGSDVLEVITRALDELGVAR